MNNPAALGSGPLTFAGGIIDVQVGGNYWTMTNVNNNPLVLDANLIYNGGSNTTLNLGSGTVRWGRRRARRG